MLLHYIVYFLYFTGRKTKSYSHNFRLNVNKWCIISGPPWQFTSYRGRESTRKSKIGDFFAYWIAIEKSYSHKTILNVNNYLFTLSMLYFFMQKDTRIIEKHEFVTIDGEPYADSATMSRLTGLSASDISSVISVKLSPKDRYKIPGGRTLYKVEKAILNARDSRVISERSPFISTLTQPSKHVRKEIEEAVRADYEEEISQAGAEQDVPLDKVTYDEARRRSEIKKVRLAEIKIRKEMGVLVEADDLDRAMAEQAALYEASKRNGEKVLPSILENKSADEIGKLLKQYNRADSSNKQVLFAHKYRMTESFFDVAIAVFDAMIKGIEPHDLVKAIKKRMKKNG